MAEFGGGGPKRIRKFYKTVSVAPAQEGHAILLDGKGAKTPARATLALPSAALAEAVAEEWRVEGEELALDAMALTRLASMAIDLGESDCGRWVDEILNYLCTDLLCYRATEPAALVERQAAAWDPLLDWAAGEFGAELTVTSGIAAVEQPAAVSGPVRARLEAMDPWHLAGLFTAVPLAGSAVIGFALAARAFPAQRLFKASRVDEHFQAERWGVDTDAAARERRLKGEFMAVDKWFELL